MLKGKKGIVFGIANDHSIAWGIAKKLSDHEAELAITYQNDTFLKRVKPLLKENSLNLVDTKVNLKLEIKLQLITFLRVNSLMFQEYLKEKDFKG